MAHKCPNSPARIDVGRARLQPRQKQLHLAHKVQNSRAKSCLGPNWLPEAATLLLTKLLRHPTKHPAPLIQTPKSTLLLVTWAPPAASGLPGVKQQAHRSRVKATGPPVKK